MSASSSDVFRFFSRSADKPPGKGSGESASHAYPALASIRNWRQVLSNFHLCPFAYEGKTYNTIEHAFQATKIALEDPRRAFAFTRESKTAIGLGDGAKAQKERKMVELSKAKLAAWAAFKDDVMARIARAKYAQCPDARRVLLATGTAQLWHAGPRIKAVRFVHLEQIRADLRSA